MDQASAPDVLTSPIGQIGENMAVADSFSLPALSDDENDDDDDDNEEEGYEGDEAASGAGGSRQQSPQSTKKGPKKEFAGRTILAAARTAGG